MTLNVGPYVVGESELEVPGLADPVPFLYYVLPENAEKAALQFQDVPELVRIDSEAFGPFPFPESEFGLVETSFWGMEHSTAVAYGSSYPAWCKAHDERDRCAGRNRWFDFILVHEVAHEWWGNSVSAEDWGHFWIHEGFGTYAEGVYVERKFGRVEADRYFAVRARYSHGGSATSSSRSPRVGWSKARRRACSAMLRSPSAFSAPYFRSPSSGVPSEAHATRS